MPSAPPVCVECAQPLTRLAPGETVIIKMQHVGDGKTRMHGLCAQLSEHLRRSLVGPDVGLGEAIAAYEKIAKFADKLGDSASFQNATWLYKRIKSRA